MEDDWVDVNTSDNKPLPPRSTVITKPSSSDESIRLYNCIEQGALKRLEASKSPIFRVELGLEPLYSTFVEHLAPGFRQRYDCSACKRFVKGHGDLALVADDGTLEPLLWSPLDITNDADNHVMFGSAITALRRRFDDASVLNEFKVVANTTKREEPKTVSRFTHMRINFPASRFRKAEPRGFASANTSELADMLKRVLDDYNLDTVRKAYQILVENKLPYSTNHVASAKWLLDLIEQNKMGKARGATQQHNLLYRYAASSFIGSLKQMRSGALSTLLENIKMDQPWSCILSQWSAICDPLHYMRPQAAPTAGNIAAAEKLFEELGLTKDDLRRRLLVQDDVPEKVIIWASQAMKDKKNHKPTSTKKIFGAVKPKEAPTKPHNLPSTSITFTRFVTKILPTAKKLECWLAGYDSITTFITGLEGTKPLMQWHDENNLASHYVWQGRRHISMHNLRPQAWNEVRCLIPLPSLWDGAPLTTTFPLLDPDGEDGHQYKYYHKQKGFRYAFVLEDSRESDLHCTPLFPEYMKGEFHGIRSTIEAFCQTEKMMDVDNGMARGGYVGGVEVARGESNAGLKMRVTRANGEVGDYLITLFE